MTTLPRTRSTDPATSREAEAHMRESGKLAKQQRLALNHVLLNPGYTAREYEFADGLAGIFHRRLVELERMGRVRRGEPRKCRVGNVRAATWWPV